MSCSALAWAPSRLETAAGDLEQQPRRDRHGDEEGEHHRQRGVGREWGSYRAPSDRRRTASAAEPTTMVSVATMVGLPTSATASIAVSISPRSPRICPVTHDVFDDDDGVVDENADREDQREQADAVDRVAHHPRGEHRQQDGRRDDDEDDDAFAPADHQHDESDDRESGEREMKQQLVRLLVRGLAVIARRPRLRDRRERCGPWPFRAAAGSRPRSRRRWRPCAWRWRCSPPAAFPTRPSRRASSSSRDARAPPRRRTTSATSFT